MTTKTTKPKKYNLHNPALASISIRVSLAIVFAYAAIGAFIQPNAWIGFVPEFTNNFIDPKLALDIISVLQLVLAVWLVTGVYVKFAAAAAIALLAGVLITDFETILITFRDIGLIGAALALIFLDD
ncbi:MAG: hypothetical protein V4678_03440 [Patescibacteria group bacterium]